MTSRLTRDVVEYAFSAEVAPRINVEPGDSVVFETWDARAGALLDRVAGAPFELPLPTPGKGNPLTGPVAIAGAEPSDAVTVRIDDIECMFPGWVGGHAHVGPLPPGRIPRPLGRICVEESGQVVFADNIRLPLRPMVGCIGTAPAGPPISSGLPGAHGGNLDHPVITNGATVFLPVFHEGGLLFVGDVHASQGDGELSGTAVEIPAEVNVTIGLEKSLSLTWPWVVDEEKTAVMTTGMEFVDVRRSAVEAMLRVLETQLGLEPADGLALISATADLRIGQAFGGMEMTMRLEIPTSLGVVPG